MTEDELITEVKRLAYELHVVTMARGKLYRRAKDSFAPGEAKQIINKVWTETLNNFQKENRPGYLVINDPSLTRMMPEPTPEPPVPEPVVEPEPAALEAPTEQPAEAPVEESKDDDRSSP
jgi:hypothetical protein